MMSGTAFGKVSLELLIELIISLVNATSSLASVKKSNLFEKLKAEGSFDIYCSWNDVVRFFLSFVDA